MNFYYVLHCLILSISFISARPWSPDNRENSIDVLNHSSSPLMTSIDSMSSNLARSLKQWAPSLTPLLSIASFGYLGYIASVMFFPAALTEAGLPLLKDFKFENRNMRTSESGFIDSLATGILKDVIGRTEAADILKNTSMNAVTDSMKNLKKSTRFVRLGLAATQGIVGRVLTALTPECISRYMCKVGQFTSLHVPAAGPMLRSINAIDFDEYTQALIDGTTIGDCNSVYFQCPL